MTERLVTALHVDAQQRLAVSDSDLIASLQGPGGRHLRRTARGDIVVSRTNTKTVGQNVLLRTDR